MKINQINQTVEIYNNNKIAQKPVSRDFCISGRDQLTLSGVAKDFQTALAAVKDVPDIREDKIKELQSAVASQSYNVDAEEISEKMLNHYFDAQI